MSEMLLPVTERLLSPGGLNIDDLPGLLGELAGPGIDAADLYFQDQVTESWVLEDGIVKEGSFHLEQGVGVRALSGEKTGFAYSNAITADALRQAAEAARSIARGGQQGRVQVLSRAAFAPLYSQDNPLDGMGRAEKVELLKRIDVATRALDPRIKQVTVSLAGVWEHILVAGLDGAMAADIRPLVRFNVSVIVEQNGRRERGGHPEEREDGPEPGDVGEGMAERRPARGTGGRGPRCHGAGPTGIGDGDGVTFELAPYKGVEPAQCRSAPRSCTLACSSSCSLRCNWVR